MGCEFGCESLGKVGMAFPLRGGEMWQGVKVGKGLLKVGDVQLQVSSYYWISTGVFLESCS